MTSQNVITVLKRALNLLDYRIIDHGLRVMYLMYMLLKNDDTLDEHELRRICFLCMLHDVGAYKTEDLDALDRNEDVLSFEVRHSVEHSVYGYLFLKNCSILGDFADVVLYHHCPYDKLQKSGCQHKDLAAKLFLVDRVDLLLQMGKLHIDDNLFAEYRDTVFSARDIDLIIALQKSENIQQKLLSDAYLDDLAQTASIMTLSENEGLSFLKTLAFFIDFRSEYTVLHTIATVNFSVEIAKRMGLSEADRTKIYYGALLHDVGKIATPVAVLEKSERLDGFEYSIIKDHVVTSEFILKDCVDDEIFKIAVRHHEKLDGSGYAHGLTADDLTLPQRIVCVADILSALYGKRSYKEPYPAQKIAAILQDMATRNQIDASVVAAVLKEYVPIVGNVEMSCSETIACYKQINLEYPSLCETYTKLLKEGSV